MRWKRPAALGLLLACLLSVSAGAMPAPPDYLPPTPAILAFPLEGDFSLAGGRVEVGPKQLCYTFQMANHTDRRQEGAIAVPFLTDPGGLDRDLRQNIWLDGAQTEGTYRFAAMPWLVSRQDSSMETWAESSLAEGLRELREPGPYRLAAFDQDTPLAGYAFTVTARAEMFVRLDLDFDPARTLLLVDGDVNWVGTDFQPERGRRPYIDLELEQGETQTFRLFLLGEDTLTYQAQRSSGGEGGFTCSAAPAAPTALWELLRPYLEVCAVNCSDALQACIPELALLEIDDQVRGGGSVVELDRLSYSPVTTDHLAAYVVPLALEPGEQAELKVEQTILWGLETQGYESNQAERFAVVCTEPLALWAEAGTLELEYRPPMDTEMVLYHNIVPLQGGPGLYQSVLDAGAGQNLYLGAVGKFRVGQGSANVILMLLLFLAVRFWPLVLILAGGVVYLIWRLVRRRRS